MSCLEHILHTLATQPGRVIVRLSTLQERAAAELRALRPDLPLRKQIEHWAELNGLVACFGPVGAAMVTFERIFTGENGGNGDQLSLNSESPFSPFPPVPNP